jgi:hypothetical protein
VFLDGVSINVPKSNQGRQIACEEPRALELKVSVRGSSYNQNSNELLVDPSFGGGIALGVCRPRLAATATSHRAVGDEVSSATNTCSACPVLNRS